MKVASLEIELLAGVARLQTDMNRATGIVSGAMGKIQRMASTARNILGTIGVGVGVGAFAHMIKGAIDAADHLHDLSLTSGIAVRDLSGLSLLAKQSGSDLDSLAASINKMSVNIGKSPEKFAALGLASKDPIKNFQALSEIFLAIDDQSQRAAFAAEVLGKSWQGAAPALSEGAEKIGEIVAAGAKLSGITEEGARRADEFGDKLEQLGASMQGPINRLASDFLPKMDAIADAMVRASESGGILATVWAGLGAVFEKSSFAKAADQLVSINEQIDRSSKMLAAGGFDLPGSFGLVTIKASDEALQKLRANITGLESQKARVLAAFSPVSAPGSDPAAAAEKAAAAAAFVAGEDAAKKQKSSAESAARAAQSRLEISVKASKDFISQMQLQTATIGLSAAQQQIFDSQQIASQMLLAGVRKSTVDAWLESAAQVIAANSAAQTSFDARERAEKAAAEEMTRLADADKSLAELTREFGAAIDEKNRLTEVEIGLIGKTAQEKETALSNLRIEIELEKKLDEIRKLAGSSGAENAAIASVTAASDRARAAAANEGLLAKQREDAEEVQKIWDNAARNIQTTLADFLSNGFQGGLDGMLLAFGKFIQRIIAEAAAAQITQALFGSQGGASGLGALGGLLGGLGGLFGGAGNAAAGVTSFGGTTFGGLGGVFDLGIAHRGGIVGALPTRQVSASLFTRAQRYHAGGLIPGEVPIIAQAGERVLTAEQQKNMGGTTMNITVNVAKGTPDQVRRAAGQGAREAVSAFSNAQRYA